MNPAAAGMPDFASPRGHAGRWLIEELLPGWARVARHPGGGFVSGLSASGEPLAGQPRTLLVQARLAYSFAVAHRLGARGNWALTAAKAAFAVIVDELRSADGGFRQSTGPEGGTRDFYDHAFVAFASAWMEHVTGDAGYRSVLRETIAFLDDRMVHPAGGYRESLEPSTAPRRQNPHMHLLEALLAAHRVTGEAEWLMRARGVVDLFLAHFFDARTGSLIEFMTEDLAPCPGERGDWREPGHHFEWVWLLLEYQALSADTRVLAPVERLYASAMQHGVRVFADSRTGVIEAMNATGDPLSLDRLLWPQTEYVKAEIAWARHFGDSDAAKRAERHFMDMRELFFGNGALLWANRLGLDGSSREDIVPTRVLYHVAFAAAELERGA
ncbi:Mannose-6-phosphate isomerase [Bosea sp. LC85]|nr:Mannose-6-phosphate isomerase [Bosea sp. LC85]